MLNSAISSGGQTTISGYLNSTADETFTIQLFSNVGIAFDGAPQVVHYYGTTIRFNGDAQGAQYLGSTSVTTDATGHATFTETFNVSLPLHTMVTSTATDENDDTSQFSVRLAAGEVLGNVYVVNSTADDDEGWADPSHLTLREAILSANNHPGLDTIDFDIGGGGVQTIAPIDTLPDIEDAVTIDGTSQPGFAGTPLIVLSGADMIGSLTGLTVHGDGVTIRGLDISSFFYYYYSQGSNFSQNGWPLLIYGDNNVLAGDFIGTDPTGTTDKPNLNAPYIDGNNNRIGGTTPADRNLLSGNAYGDLSINGKGNVVEGNYVGTDVTGTRPLFNGLYPSTNLYYAFVSFTGNGIYVSGQATIGGSVPGGGQRDCRARIDLPFALSSQRIHRRGEYHRPQRHGNQVPAQLRRWRRNRCR